MTDAPRLTVDLASGVAPWRQIREQLTQYVASGALPVGTRLPTIRQLAADLGLAAGTVARAYRELEANGTLHTARRRGTVVAALPPGTPTDPARTATEQYVTRLRAMGVDADTAVAAVRACFDDLDETAHRTTANAHPITAQ